MLNSNQIQVAGSISLLFIKGKNSNAAFAKRNFTKKQEIDDGTENSRHFTFYSNCQYEKWAWEKSDGDSGDISK